MCLLPCSLHILVTAFLVFLSFWLHDFLYVRFQFCPSFLAKCILLKKQIMRKWPKHKKRWPKDKKDDQKTKKKLPKWKETDIFFTVSNYNLENPQCKKQLKPRKFFDLCLFWKLCAKCWTPFGIKKPTYLRLGDVSTLGALAFHTFNQSKYTAMQRCIVIGQLFGKRGKYFSAQRFVLPVSFPVDLLLWQ